MPSDRGGKLRLYLVVEVVEEADNGQLVPEVGVALSGGLDALLDGSALKNERQGDADDD